MTTCSPCPPTPPPFYVVGTAITSQVSIVNGAGDLFDPATVYAFSHSPSGVVTSLVVTHVSLGVYTATFTPTAPGLWIARFSDSATPPTNANITIDDPLFVNPLLF